MKLPSIDWSAATGVQKPVAQPDGSTSTLGWVDRALRPILDALVEANNELDTGNLLAVGTSTIPRTEAPSVNSLTSGTALLTYFTSRRSFTMGRFRVPVGTAASGLTLGRMGLYTVATNGDLTLVASSASSTTLFTTANQTVSVPLSASYDIVKGQRYATAPLFVGTTMPQFANRAVVGALTVGEAANDPRLCGQVSGLSDLPASIAAADVNTTIRQHYIAIQPAL